MLDLSATLHALSVIDPAALAIEDASNSYSWGRFFANIQQIQALMNQVGMPLAGRVGIMLRNRPSQVAALAAVISSDRCVVTVNPVLPDDRLHADIEALGIGLLIGEAADLDRPGLDGLYRAQNMTIIQLAPELGRAIVRPDRDQVSESTAAGLSPDVVVEMLTSGTTGAPKRVPLKRSAFANSIGAALAYERGRDAGAAPQLRSGVNIVGSPTTHIGGVYGVLTGLLSGRLVYLLEKFSVVEWHRAVVKHRPRVVGAVPAALRMILEANLPREDLSSLAAITSGTAPLDPAIADAFLERYDVPVLQNYGATEFAGAIAGWSLSDFRKYWREKYGAVGRIHDNVKARITHLESGEPLPFGEEGLLELQAEQIGSPNDWLRTSDRAVLDADSFLFIRGRADNAIIRGGFKVHPDEVVDVLHRHPAVREAAVVGIPDARLGAVPVAAVILSEGAVAPSEEELRDFARAHLLPYQVPTKIRIVPDLPRTPSMKPSAPMLRTLFSEQPSEQA